MKVRIKKLTPDAVVPTKAHPTDAGIDLTAVSKTYDLENDVVSYGFGLAFEIPDGYAGFVFPRSSVYKTGMGLSNCVGIVDSAYRGEVSAKFYPSAREKDYEIGDRVAQMVILPYPEIELEVAEELADGERGTNGYGSSGK